MTDSSVTSRSKMACGRKTVKQQLLSVLYVLFLLDWVHLSQTIHTSKTCKRFLDVRSDKGIDIEPFEQSRVEFNITRRRQQKGNTIRFEFHTTEENGILFYGLQRNSANELIILRLERGYLFYTVDCPTVSADERIHHKPRNRKLNDGQWHAIALTIRPRKKKNQIKVDGVRMKLKYKFGCGWPTSLVFGGVGQHDKSVVDQIMNMTVSYSGCIRGLKFPFKIRSSPRYYIISNCNR